MIDASARDAVCATWRPREQLLVCEDGGEIVASRCSSIRALANLAAHDPWVPARLDHNLGDFLLAIEGVSHFIYAVGCARA